VAGTAATVQIDRRPAAPERPRVDMNSQARLPRDGKAQGRRIIRRITVSNPKDS
jgi:hypothetical protein